MSSFLEERHCNLWYKFAATSQGHLANPVTAGTQGFINRSLVQSQQAKVKHIFYSKKLKFR